MDGFFFCIVVFLFFFPRLQCDLIIIINIVIKHYKLHIIRVIFTFIINRDNVEFPGKLIIKSRYKKLDKIRLKVDEEMIE